MTITINWNRAEKTAHVPQPRDVMDFYAAGEDPAFAICRQMVNAGWQDQTAEVVDETGARVWLIHTIHGTAQRFHPTPEESAQRAADIKAAKQGKKS